MENNNSTSTQPVQNMDKPNLNLFKEKYTAIVSKISPIFKETFNKVYQNKMLFWLFTGIGGFMLILIIIGSIYKMANSGNDNKIITTKPTQSTQSAFVNSGDKIYDDLTLDEDHLHIIRDSLINYDPFQLRLTPPVLEFDVNLENKP